MKTIDNSLVLGSKQELILQLTRAGRLDDNTAKLILMERAEELSKETLDALVNLVGLPYNDLVALQIARIKESGSLLSEIIHRNKKFSDNFLATLENLLLANWPSPALIADIYEAINPFSDHIISNKIIEVQGKHDCQRLINIATEICTREFSYLHFHEKLDFCDEAFQKVKEGIKNLRLYEFHEAITKMVKDEFTDNLESINFDELIESMLRLGQTTVHTFVVCSPFWKKLRQNERDKLVSRAGISWNVLVLANGGLGVVRWSDMKRKEQFEWIKIENEKIPSYEYERLEWSLFNHEIDLLKRKKKINRKSLDSFTQIIKKFGGQHAITMFFGSWPAVLENFQSLPVDKQYDLLALRILPIEIKHELKNYSILTFSHWLKLRKSGYLLFSKDLIIKNTNWRKESPYMINKAAEMFQKK